MKKLIPAFLIAAAVWTGCAKEGLGGDATLVVRPQHHGVTIPNLVTYPDSVFIKFGVKEVPADPTHDYDALFVGEAGEDHVHCEGLKWGYYSVYATGYDSVGLYRVSGGVTLKIKRKDRDQEIDLNCPVTED